MTMIVTIVVYCVLVVVCRRKDKQDELKWACLPLLDNYDEDEYAYELHVFTGFADKAGTTTKVFFNLIGTEGLTGVRQLDDGVRQGFNQGEAVSFLMKTPMNLGVPLDLHIWLEDAGNKEGKLSWQLAKLVVINRMCNDWYLFNCHDWLRKGWCEKFLRAAAMESEVASSRDLFKNNFKQKLYNDHIWLSVVSRKNRSNFSRVQRLSCCLAVLFIAMIASAMWYKTGQEAEQGLASNAFSLGPISVTVQDIKVSIMTSIQLVPATLLITTLFMKAKVATKKTTISIPHSLPLWSRPWPHWCAYIAWMLIVIAISASGFFTLLYSFQWGGEVSKAWLTAYLMSFATSALLIQPVQVFTMAITTTFIWKRDSDTEQFTQQLGRMQEVPPSEIPFLTIGTAQESAATAVVEQDTLDGRMRVMLRQILAYIVLLFLMVFVCQANLDANAFRQNSDLNNRFLKNIRTMRDELDFYLWAKTVFVPSAYYTVDLNESTTSEYDSEFMDNMVGYRLGPPRFRQLRSKRDALQQRLAATDIYLKRCSHAYSLEMEDQMSYDLKWSPLTNSSTAALIAEEPVKSAFVYTSMASLNESIFLGYLAMYSGGGYIFNLGDDPDSVVPNLDELQRLGWIDHFTRAIFVELSVWNANSNLMSSLTLCLEFPPSGGVFMWKQVQVVNLYRYSGAMGVLNLATEVALAICMTVLAGLTAKDMVQQRRQFFTCFLNVLLITSLVSFYVALACYVMRTLWTITCVENMMNHPGENVNFKPLTTWNSSFLVFISLSYFTMHLRILHVLRYVEIIAMLSATLSLASKKLFDFCTVFGVYLLASSLTAYILFTPSESYSTFLKSMATLMSASMGKFDFQYMLQKYGNVGGLFLLAYLCVMYFIILNLFVTIINDSFASVRTGEVALSDDSEVVSHMLAVLSASFFRPFYSSTPADDKDGTSLVDDTDVNPMQDLLDRVQCLDEIVTAGETPAILEAMYFLLEHIQALDTFRKTRLKHQTSDSTADAMHYERLLQMLVQAIQQEEEHDPR